MVNNSIMIKFLQLFPPNYERSDFQDIACAFNCLDSIVLILYYL